MPIFIRDRYVAKVMGQIIRFGVVGTKTDVVDLHSLNSNEEKELGWCS